MKNIKYVLVSLMLGGGFGANIGAYLLNLFQLDSSILVIQKGFVIGACIAVIPTLLVLISSTIVKWIRSGDKNYYQGVQKTHLKTNFN